MNSNTLLIHKYKISDSSSDCIERPNRNIISKNDNSKQSIKEEVNRSKEIEKLKIENLNLIQLKEREKNKFENEKLNNLINKKKIELLEKELDELKNSNNKLMFEKESLEIFLNQIKKECKLEMEEKTENFNSVKDISQNNNEALTKTKIDFYLDQIEKEKIKILQLNNTIKNYELTLNSISEEKIQIKMTNKKLAHENTELKKKSKYELENLFKKSVLPLEEQINNLKESLCQKDKEIIEKNSSIENLEILSKNQNLQMKLKNNQLEELTQRLKQEQKISIESERSKLL